MRKKIILPLTFIALMIVLFYTQPHLLAISSFLYGKNEYANCEIIKNKYSVFCREGQAETLIKSPLYNENILKFIRDYSNKQPELIGLGLYISQTPKKIIDFHQSNFSGIEYESIKFVADGIGFGTLLFQSMPIEQSKGFCNHFDEINLKSACLFGMGRAFYFNNFATKETVSRILVSNEPEDLTIAAGLGFASIFAGDECDINKKQNAYFQKGCKLAYSTFRFLLEKKSNGSIEDQCLFDKKHFSTCLDKNFD